MAFVMKDPPEFTLDVRQWNRNTVADGREMAQDIEKLLNNDYYNWVEISNLRQRTETLEQMTDAGDAFDESGSYAEGDYCIYNNALYRFTTAKAPGAWDEAAVQRVSITEELREIGCSLGGLKFEVVSALPSTPDPTTVYLIGE